MNASHGEVNLADNLTDKRIYPFEYLGDVQGMDTERYAYGEIRVPGNFENRYSDKDGIHVHIPFASMVVVYFSLEVVSNTVA